MCLDYRHPVMSPIVGKKERGIKWREKKQERGREIKKKVSFDENQNSTMYLYCVYRENVVTSRIRLMSSVGSKR